MSYTMSMSGGSNVVNQALVAAVGEEKMAEGHLLGPLSMQQSSHHLAGVSSLGLESPESPLDKSKEDKIKRRKVTKACLYCQKSHMSCDRERPCKRCVQRNIQHLCRDMDGKRRGRKGGYLSGEVPNAKPLVPDTQGDTFSFPQPALDLVFASLDEISPMLYQYERTRAIEEEKNDPGRHLDELAKQVDDPAKQVMSAFWNWLHHRLPAQMHNDVAVTRADLENIKRKILLSRPVQDAELESCKHEITLQLKQWRATFQPLEIPVVMWGRNFQVLDYNKTFSDICGGHLPDNELSMLRLLSVTSIVNLLRAVTHLLKTPTCDMTNFTCSWQVQLPSGLNYLEGVCWLVVRRDPLQIPLIFMGVFTPANPMSGLPSLRDPK